MTSDRSGVVYVKALLPKRESSGGPPIGLSETYEQIPRHLKAQPAAGHAGSDLEEVGYDAFVEAANPFLADDHFDRIPY